MTEHLPECACNHADERGCFLISAETDRCVDCICPQLRACERRVLEEEQSYLPAVLFGNGDEKAVLQIRDTAYAAGVQAARDAVAGVAVRKDTSHDMRVQALAAIDALRVPDFLAGSQEPAYPRKEKP